MTSPTVEALRTRLQVGQQWLTTEHQRWLAEDPQVASDERFSRALAGWDALERVFRSSDYAGCIWGPGKACPEETVVLCDGCVGVSA